MPSLTLIGDGRRTVASLLASSPVPSPLSLDCGGAGTCGKCRVLFDSPAPPPNEAETRLLSPAELSAGIRLACQSRPVGKCSLRLSGDRAGYRIEVSWSRLVAWIPCVAGGSDGDGLALAVDVGTTTVVVALVDRHSGALLGTEAFLNPQRAFGADVLSRVRAAVDGDADALRSAILVALSSAMVRLLFAVGRSVTAVTLVAVAGNAVMSHLLLGLDVSGFGAAPFAPAALSFPEAPLAGFPAAWPVRHFPAISAFVGGDIVAGLAYLGLPASRPEPVLFIDMGTNAEMALSVGGRLLCASAAAGPAFEGGSISCGTGCVPGAVASVFSQGSTFGYTLVPWAGEFSGAVDETVEGGSDGGAASREAPHPVGLCGSALIDFLAVALDAELIAADGSLAPICEQSGVLLDWAGSIRLTQADVREAQLAKAAIRAGIAVLCEAAGIAESEIATVYLAGGFGRWLSETSAIRVGLLPPGFAGKTESVGNVALGGAVQALFDPSMAERVETVRRVAQTVSLADHPSFNQLFLDSMGF